MRGRLSKPVSWHGSCEISARGPIALQLEFIGSVHPRLERVTLTGDLTLDQVPCDTVSWSQGQIWLDGVSVGRIQRVAEPIFRLAQQLMDLEFMATTRPQGDLLVKFAHGVQIHLGADSVVTLRGAARGPAYGLRLTRPVQVSVDGEGFTVRHEHLRWLSALAHVRICRATLTPTGGVELHSGQPTLMGRAVNRGLRHVSQRLTKMVRVSPRFAKVRAFLR